MNSDIPFLNNSDSLQTFLKYLSEVLGWIYFLAWSASFYGQVIENYRRHKVTGLNFDYIVYNLVGFSGYTTYTIWGYIDTELGTGKITLQDIFFAAHGLLLTIVQLSQIVYYYDKTDKNQKVHNFTITILCTMIWGALLLLFIERVLGYYNPHITPSSKYVFNSLVYLGWCKVIITLIKYMPQAYSNYKRKSTIGWNIHNMLLDFTGGLFSFLQSFIDTFRDPEYKLREETSKALNTAKYALSFITMFFDIIFITQHYILYRNSNSDLNTNEHNQEQNSNETPIIPQDTNIANSNNN